MGFALKPWISSIASRLVKDIWLGWIRTTLPVSTNCMRCGYRIYDADPGLCNGDLLLMRGRHRSSHLMSIKVFPEIGKDDIHCKVSWGRVSFRSQLAKGYLGSTNCTSKVDAHWEPTKQTVAIPRMLNNVNTINVIKISCWWGTWIIRW